MGSADYIEAAAEAVLAAAQDALDETRTGNPTPGAAMLVHGRPRGPIIEAMCETFTGLITVHMDLARSFDFAPQSNTCQLLTHARLMLTVYRCYPPVRSPDGTNVEPPDPTAEHDAAAALMRDAWCLITWFRDLRGVDDGLIPGLPCAVVELDQPRIIEPSGGVAGFEWSIRFMANDSGPEEMPS